MVYTTLQTGPKRSPLPLIRRTMLVFSLIVAGFLPLHACAERFSNSHGVAQPTLAQLPPSATELRREMIVFDSDRGGNYEIYVMRRDGSNPRALTQDARFDSWWGRISPDRRRILFYRTPKGTHDRDYTQTSLWMMNADGSEQREIRPVGTDGWQLQGHAEWSPDGQRLVMFGGRRTNPQIYITANTGGEPRQLTSRGGSNLDPSWSPDGATIVFTGCPTPICFPGSYEVYTVPARGERGRARRITRDSIRDHDPYFSPDGSRIAWLSQTSSAGVIGTWNIRVASADGSGIGYVTNDNHVNSKPEWSRDGRLIYFHRLEVGRGRRFGIFSISPDGSGMTEITQGHPGNNEYPSN